MSFVGLTTIPKAYLQYIDAVDPDLRIHFSHQTKPGLISLYMVYSPDYFLNAVKLSEKDLREVKMYDEYYIKNSSFLLDLIIISRALILVMGFTTKVKSRKVSDSKILFPEDTKKDI
jgi:lipopolysaccharide/colanic/teichoic acid biosynthesis glycosyltransferase